MPTIQPLADELRDAIALLRAHRYYRAALRLEKASSNVLQPARAKKKKTARRVQLRTASGKHINIKLAFDDSQIQDTNATPE
jgi:hypothetical protein